MATRVSIIGLFLFLFPASSLAADQPIIPAESAAEAEARHERVAERRKGIGIICHRGASEFAHENTLEAYRATFELGADGNEMDIRATKDGVLVMFHDDMLDRLLDAYGDVSDFTWEELQHFRFRNPGRFGLQCRIPTFMETLELHRKYAGLIHLDIKRMEIDGAVADLITRMEMWDHVIAANTDTGGAIRRDRRFQPRRYKAGLYLDHAEVFPDLIAAALKKPGDDVIVDDPRGTILALGRKLGSVSKRPVAPRPIKPSLAVVLPTETQLIMIVRKADDWDRPATSAFAMVVSGERIRARARAAEQLLAMHASSKDAFATLEERVRNRSLHRHWMYHGFDGAMALRTLLLLRAPQAVDIAHETLWRDDPNLVPVVDPRWKNPRSWTDFRVKMVIFPTLEQCPSAATEKLCRDYLALSDEEARKLGPEQFEQAGKALLTVSPKPVTVLELMRHRLSIVRGRAILDCLAHTKEAWALTALEKAAPHALRYRIEQ